MLATASRLEHRSKNFVAMQAISALHVGGGGGGGGGGRDLILYMYADRWPAEPATAVL